MSRNLCSSECHFCGEEPELTGDVRQITKEDTFVYFDEYKGMLVAEAECWLCGAKYLAWIDGAKRERYAPYPLRYAPYPFPRFCDESPVADLSFRSTFDDEPGEADMPVRNGAALKRAAPEMYGECEWALAVAEARIEGTWDELMARFRPLLAKARGES